MTRPGITPGIRIVTESTEYAGAWCLDCLDIVVRAIGTDNVFYRELRSLSNFRRSSIEQVARTVAILQRVQGVVREGRPRSIKAAAVAATFTDLLDLADHLRTEGHYLAAVAVAGAVLESELRRLHDARLTPLSSGSIEGYNNALRVLYNEGKFPEYIDEDDRHIKTWANLRNKCDHGERSNSDDLPIYMPDGVTAYPTVRPKEVEAMISWIGDFIERHAT